MSKLFVSLLIASTLLISAHATTDILWLSGTQVVDYVQMNQSYSNLQASADSWPAVSQVCITALGSLNSATQAQNSAIIDLKSATNALNFVPFFLATLNASTMYVGASYQDIGFSNEIYDVGGYYDPITCRYTPPNGTYLITAKIWISTYTVGGGPFFLSIACNGTAWNYTTFMPSGVGFSCVAQSVLYLDGSTYVRAQVYNYYNSTCYFGVAYSSFSGVRLSR